MSASLTRLLLITLLASVPCAHAQRRKPTQNNPTQLTASQIARRVLPSVVLIETDCGRGRVSVGSGFVVERGLVATNKHVVRCGGMGYVTLFGQGAKHAVTAKYLDPARDLALLKVEGLNAPALPLRDAQSLAIGEKVYAAGNPQGLEGTFSDGIISGLRLEAGLIQFTAAISQGSSGGPVIDEYGRVVGVTVSFVTSGQNLNFAVPASFLRTLVADVRGGKVNDSITASNRPAAAPPSEARTTPAPARRAGALSYTLIIDNSRTIGEQLPVAKLMALALVEQNAPDDGARVVSFRSGGGRRSERFTTDARALAASIEAITAGSDGWSRPIRDALQSAIEGAANPRREYDTAGVVIITHGIDNISLTSWEELRTLARESKVPIYGVLFPAELPDMSGLATREWREARDRFEAQEKAGAEWMKIITQESGGELFVPGQEEQFRQFMGGIMRALRTSAARQVRPR